MSRIADRFTSLKAENKTALIPFITAGDPVPDKTVAIMHGLVKGGADIIELGVPFSDPMADGPVIQRASERALEHNISLRDVLGIVKEFRQLDHETPVILMGYMNPIEVMGYQVFAEKAAEAGVDGALIVDLPPEEAPEFIAEMKPKGLDQVFLIAPTTRGKRLKNICNMASGFIYYVSLKGVTGSNQLDVAQVSEKLTTIREHTDLPVGVGFGIKDPETAAAVAKVSDAVVVGSALVDHLYQQREESAALAQVAEKFIQNLRSAMDV